jgi:hypothetical protein
MNRELGPTKPAFPVSSPKEQSEIAGYIAQARNPYATSDEIEIDDRPDVSVAERGAWVAAWVWVDQEGAGPRGKKSARFAKA